MTSARCGETLAWSALPHDVPFLLVDRVIAVEGDRARVLRVVTRNDALLRGAVTMPPTLVVEAIAQAAGILVASLGHTLAGGSLTAIDRFVFRGPVRSGDRVVLEVALHRVHGRFCSVTGRAVVEGEVRAEGQLTLSRDPPRLPSCDPSDGPPPAPD